jgi:hypothetical protein
MLAYSPIVPPVEPIDLLQIHIHLLPLQQPAQPSVAEAQLRAKALRDDPVLTQLHAYAEDRLRVNRDGFVSNGKLIKCPDGRLEVLLRAVLASLELPDVSVKPIEIFAATDSASIRKLYTGVFRCFGESLGDDRQSRRRRRTPEPAERASACATDLTVADYATLVWPAGIETLILLVGGRVARERSRNTWALGGLAGLGAAPSQLDPHLLARLRKVANKNDQSLYGLVTAYAFRHGKKAFVYVPLGTEVEAARHLAVVMDALEHGGAALLLVNIMAIDELPRAARQLLAKVLEGITHVRVYRIDWRTVGALLADILSGGDGGGAPPSGMPANDAEAPTVDGELILPEQPDRRAA